jgi:hypothetical protein
LASKQVFWEERAVARAVTDRETERKDRYLECMSPLRRDGRRELGAVVTWEPRQTCG